MTHPTQAERITALEVRVYNLEKKVDEVADDVKSLDGKMDQLLELKNKGVGAFWLISTLVGTGIVSAAVTIFHYLTGKSL